MLRDGLSEHPLAHGLPIRTFEFAYQSSHSGFEATRQNLSAELV
jgi:hypothetical protein